MRRGSVSTNLHQSKPCTLKTSATKSCNEWVSPVAMTKYSSSGCCSMFHIAATYSGAQPQSRRMWRLPSVCHSGAAVGDAASGANDLLCNEAFRPQGRFVVEKNTGASNGGHRPHGDSRVPESCGLGHGVGTAQAKQDSVRSPVCRRCHRSIRWNRRCRDGFRNSGSVRFRAGWVTDADAFQGFDGLFEGQPNRALPGQVVQFVGLKARRRLEDRCGSRSRPLRQLRLDRGSQFEEVSEGRDLGVTGGTDDPVALFQKGVPRDRPHPARRCRRSGRSAVVRAQSRRAL